MKIKVVIGILAFIVGSFLAAVSESFFRTLIQDIFVWSTSGNIQFVGKGFYIFPNTLYMLMAGTAFVMLMLASFQRSGLQVLKGIIVFLVLFGISLVLISAIDAHFKLIACTACDDGIRKLGKNEIMYGNILSGGLILAMIPSVYGFVKQLKK